MIEGHGQITHPIMGGSGDLSGKIPIRNIPGNLGHLLDGLGYKDRCNEGNNDRKNKCDQ